MSVTAVLAPLSGVSAIDCLVHGTRWSSLSAGLTLSYSIPGADADWTLGGAYAADAEPASFLPLAASHEQQAVRDALRQWAAVAAVGFVEVADAADSSAVLRFAYTDWQMDSGTAGYAYLPTASAAGGDVWLNAALRPTLFAAPAAGSLGFFVLLHEIGHALGLKHPDEASAYSAATLPGLQDSLFESIESRYVWPGVVNTEGSIDRLPSTPMARDIDAIQQLYGASPDFHAGDDLYEFSSSGKYLQTIHDAGGIDTIRVAGSQDQAIDLRPDAWSEIGQAVQIAGVSGATTVVPQTLRIHRGTLIENAGGGAGNDRLTGNAADNRLDGGAGNDTLDGGAGADRLSGGSGADLVVVDNGPADVVVDFAVADGDRIDLARVLPGLVGLGLGDNPFATGHLRLVSAAADTRLEVDADGGGDGFRPLLRLDGVAAESLSRASFVQGFSPDGLGDAVLAIPAVAALELTGSSAGVTLSTTTRDDPVNVTSVGHQGMSRSARLEDGGYVLVWASSEAIGATGAFSWAGRILGQRFDALGRSSGSQFEVAAASGPNALNFADVAALADGGYVVTWTDWDASDGDDSGVFGQRYDAAGNRAGGAFRANTLTDGRQERAEVIGRDGGGFAVAWTEWGNPITVGVQNFDAQGNKLGDPQALGGYRPALFALAGGGYAVSSNSTDGSGTRHQYQIFAADGLPVGAPVNLGELAYAPSMDVPSAHFARLDNGGHVAVWQSGDPAYSTEIRGQLLDAAFSPVGASFAINSYRPFQQDAPQVAALPGGRFVVVWQSNAYQSAGATGSDSDGFAIIARLYGNDGLPVGDQFQVNQYTADSQLEVDVVTAGSGFVVSWTSGPQSATAAQDGSAGGIFSRRFDADGVALAVTQLTGSSGADTLVGGLGAQVMSGLAGNDIYAVDDVADRVVESGGGGSDLIVASVDHQLPANVETLQLAGGARLAIGNDTANQLFGTPGANEIDGRGGVDTMSGGAGDDLYYVSQPGDSVVEAAGEGRDGIVATIDLVLPANVEDGELRQIQVALPPDPNFPNAPASYQLAPASAQLVGNVLGNRLRGSGANETFTPLAGNDTIDGGLGLNTVVYAGPGAGYRVEREGNAVRVRDIDPNNGDEGTDLLSAIELLQFSDTQLAVAIDQRVNSQTAGNQSQARVASLADGGYVVVWVSDPRTAVDSPGWSGDIHGQRFTARGVASGGEFSIAPGGANGSNFPDVTALADGGFVAIWTDWNGADGSDSGVFGQRYDASGVAVGSAFVANTGSAGRQERAEVSGLEGGGFAVAWTEWDTLSTGVQAFDAAGARVGGGHALAGFKPSLSALPGGGYVVASNIPAGSSSQQQYQRFGADGQPLGTPVDLGPATYAYTIDWPSAQFARLGDGGYVAVWQGGQGFSSEIFGQRLNPSFAPVGDRFVINQYQPWQQESPQIAVLANGRFVVVWQSNANGSGGASGTDSNEYAVAARLYNADGSPVGDQFQVNHYTDSGQYEVDVAAVGSGFVVTWTSDYYSARSFQDGSKGGIYSRMYDGDGAPVYSLVLQGGNGDDPLPGGSGGQLLIGGNGNDLYVVDDAGDVVVEGDGEGTADEVLASISYRLDAQGTVENLSLAGSADLDADGNDVANRIVGNGGANSLSGQGGNDVLDGGPGPDRLDGGPGNNALNGGAGEDTAVLDGLPDDYVAEVITQSSAAFRLDGRSPFTLNGVEATDLVRLVHRSGRVDQLIGVETLHFSGDGSSLRIAAGALPVSRHAPTAGADDASVGEDGSVVIDVLANDSDADPGDSASLVSANSTRVRPSGSTLVYTPGPDYQSLAFGQTATDTFTYAIRDRDGLGGSATVSVTVVGANDAPLAGADTLEVGEDAVLSAAVGLLDNDRDVDSGDRLVLLGVNGSSTGIGHAIAGRYGVFSVGADGRAEYVLDNALSAVQQLKTGDSLSDTLDYTIADRSGATATATLTVAIAGRDDLPIAGDDGATYVAGSGVLSLAIADLLANDLTPNLGEHLNFAGLGTARSGAALAVVGDRLRYDPGQSFAALAAGQQGEDSFTYAIADSRGNTATATVALTILGSGPGVGIVRAGEFVDIAGHRYELVRQALGWAEARAAAAARGGQLAAFDSPAEHAAVSAWIAAHADTSAMWIGASDVAREGSWVWTDGSPLAFSAWAEADADGAGDDAAAIAPADGRWSDRAVGNRLAYLVEYASSVGPTQLGGGDGADIMLDASGLTLAGGRGDDRYLIDRAGQAIVENAGEGRDTVFTTLAAYTLGNGVENLQYTGRDNFAGTGNHLNNVISGNVGDDTLRGGSGVDTLIGGGGDDIYEIDNAADRIVELADAGRDGVHTALRSFSLGSAALAQVEDLRFTGSAAFNGSGNAAANRLDGGSGNDLLRGLGGDDTLFGDAGDDRLLGGDGDDRFGAEAGNDSYDGGAGSDLVEMGGLAGDYVFTRPSPTLVTIAGNGRRLALTGIEQLVFAGDPARTRRLDTDDLLRLAGSPGDDRLTGEDGDDLIRGMGGRDILDGSGGSDALEGGDGNDTLIGSRGEDLLDGGRGNDLYLLSDDADRIVENAGAGIDTIRIDGLDRFSLEAIASVENLDAEATGGNLVLTGNGAANLIQGSAGNDRLFGLAGNDTLRGGSGSDLLDGGAGIDRLEGGDGDDVYLVRNGDTIIDTGGHEQVNSGLATWTLGSGLEDLAFVGSGNFAGYGNGLDNTIRGGSGNDLLAGRLGDDLLLGDDGDDRLLGGGGNDTLAGGGGVDTLSGGVGNDVFVFATAPGGSVDEVMDFASNSDKILLDLDIFSGITEISAPGLMSGSDAGMNADTRLVYAYDPLTRVGTLHYDADGSGEAHELLAIARFHGVASLAAGDLIAG